MDRNLEKVRQLEVCLELTVHENIKTRLFDNSKKLQLTDQQPSPKYLDQHRQ